MQNPPDRPTTRRRFLQGIAVLVSSYALPSAPRLLAQTPTIPPSPTHTSTVGPTVSPTLQPTLFSGDRALGHAAAQMRYIPRHPGTVGSRRCGDYILEQLEAQGWATEEQPFTYRDTPCRNLIGKRGNGPILIIGAHYDTRRRADEDPTPENRLLPVPGGNDGASGIGVLLELARVIKPEDLGRTIWLVGFDAEDNGGLDGWDWIVGSQYMADNLTIIPQGMLLVDMIGDADQQIYYEANSHRGMSRAVWNIAANLGYETFIPTFRYSILDDHIPFIRRGIPAIDIIDFDYPYWHTIEDTLDKISATSLENVGRTVQEWLLQGTPGLPSPPDTSETHTPTPTYTSTVNTPTPTHATTTPSATPSAPVQTATHTQSVPTATSTQIPPTSTTTPTPPASPTTTPIQSNRIYLPIITGLE